MLCTKYGRNIMQIVLHKLWIQGLSKNPQICQAILGLHPMKHTKHGLIMTDPCIGWAPKPQIAPKEVCKAWVKADPPKINQEKQNGVTSIENHANNDY